MNPAGVEVQMEKMQSSQAQPMTIWCLLVGVLIAIVIAIGVVLFSTPGRDSSPIHSTPSKTLAPAHH